MAKKAKALKIKQYKPPPEKYLVVIDTWGVYGNFDAADLNHIGAWFEIMLRDEYPEMRITAIYYQRTHQNIIVELPKEVNDIEHLLGAHICSKFLNGPPLEQVAYIYEYNYATYGDPSDKNFVVGHPMYTNIPPGFPIKYPYPLPSPAPPPPREVPYARAIPPQVNERIAARLRDQTRVKTPEKECLARSPVPPDKGKGRANEVDSAPATENTFTPYVRPAHLSSTLAESLQQAGDVDRCSKTDPYDEEEEANSFLKTPDDAQAFLTSLLKQEETSDDTGTMYQPSAELLDVLSTLPEDMPNVQVKAEVENQLNIKTEPTEFTVSDYQPSDELLAAFATLQDMSGGVEPIKSEPTEGPGIRVKEEPQDLMDLGTIKPSSRSWNRQHVPKKRPTPNKRYVEEETEHESSKRIKKEEY